MVKHITGVESRVIDQLRELRVVSSLPEYLQGDIADVHRFSGLYANIHLPQGLTAASLELYIGSVIPQGHQTPLDPAAGRYNKIKSLLGCFRWCSKESKHIASQLTFKTMHSKAKIWLREDYARQKQKRNQEMTQSS